MNMTHEMKKTLIAAACFVLLAAACQKAESPPEVRGDVAEAQAEASQEMAQAETRASSDLAITAAEGEHKIAIERCEALAGDEQQRCKAEADAALDSARGAAREQARS